MTILHKRPARLISAPRVDAQDMDRNIDALIRRHRNLKDEPLLLAVHYVPERSRDICILEIADGFGANTIDPFRSMYEVAYGPTPEFPMVAGQFLKLLLTNPVEWKKAVDQKWGAVKKLQKAITRDKVRVLFKTPQGAALWRLISG